MSEIKALEDLREWAQGFNARLLKGLREQILKACDEIEAEIADRYMRLPVDADGVPIHVGDVVVAISTGESETVSHVSEKSIEIERFGVKPSSVRHAKPRTLEDVLEEYANEYYKLVRDGLGSIAKLKTRKAADEIRELLGGGES